MCRWPAEIGQNKEELLRLEYEESPFSFSVGRQHSSDNKVFDTGGQRLIYKVATCSLFLIGHASKA